MMDNKIKNALILLFVVGTLLLMIGSVSATNTDELNKNSEASYDLNNGLSCDDSITNLNNKVSNQLTIGNIDEETNGVKGTEDLNSNNVVSSTNDATINLSSENSNAEDKLGSADIVLSNNVLNPTVNVGGIVSFEIFGRNNGSNYGDEWIPINMYFDSTVLEYVGFTVGVNPDTGVVYTDNYPEPIVDGDHILFGYHAKGWFDNGHCFNFTVHFRALEEAYNTATYVLIDDWNKGKINYTTIKRDANFTLVNKALDSAALVNDTISFEIFSRNLGGTFDQEWIPIDVYFNSAELEYLGFTVGVNPDNGIIYSDSYPEPRVYDGHVQFGYHANWWFANGHCFNFTVHFKVLKEGYVATYAQIGWYQTEYHQIGAANATWVGHDSDFKLEYKALSQMVNVEDNVTFEVFARNMGEVYRGEYVGIMVYYNPQELEYIDFKPGRNPDNGWYFEDSYPEPIVNQDEGWVYFGYKTDFNFLTGYCFNFTVNFKSLKEGRVGSSASMEWWQIRYHYVNASAHTYVTDADFALENNPVKEIVNVGEIASFEIIAYNREGTYYGSYIGFDMYFDENKLDYKYFNVTEQPNGVFSLESSGATSSDGKLGSSVLEANAGHLHFGYTPNRGANTNCSFKFTVSFEVLENGKLQNDAVLTWAQSENQQVKASGRAYAGKPSLNLTKIVHDEFVNKGDDVYFDVYLENNGTLSYTDSKGYFIIEDWYPDGLEYMDCEAHTPGITVTKDKNANLLSIKQLISESWDPGSSLNVTLHFKATKSGILCNYVFGPWSTSTYSTVVVDLPDLNLTKTVDEQYAEVDDIVYFYIYVENNGSVPYYDHNNTVKDLIIHDIYPEGLEYVGYEVNSDSQGGRFKNESEGNNQLAIVYTPNADKWMPGSYINITLKFKATKEGKFTNTAKILWLWKDWGPEEEQKLIEREDSATVIVGIPSFTIEKISNYGEVELGDIVSFTIIYTNTGLRNITGVYIKDNNYTQGLVYSGYSNQSLWRFDGVDTWYYDGILASGDSISLDLIFNTTSVGEKNNTAIAGHNITDDTYKSTDKVKVYSPYRLRAALNEVEEPEEEEPIEPEDEPVEPEEEDKKENKTDVPVKPKGHAVKSAALPTAGNPLFVLVLCLISLCFVPRNKK